MAKRKNAKRKKHTSLIWLFLIILAVTVVGLVCLTEFTDFNIKNLFPENNTISEEKQDLPTENTNEEEVVSSGIVEDEVEKPTQYEGNNPNSEPALTGNITYAGVLNKKITIRVNIDQFLNNGTCKLTMRSGDSEYSEEVNIVESAATSTCKGFDIPLDKVSKSGDWSIEILVESNGKSGKINGKVKI